MKIERTYIEGNKLYIVLDTETNITKVYLDSISNKDNMYSDLDYDHTKVINTVITEGKAKYSVDITAFKENAFIITVISKSKDIALSIDEESLYYAKVNMLLEFCNTCLDKNREYKIILCELRSNLLNYALSLNLLTDAIQHYIDLTRILEISNGIEYECNGCKNGCCSL